MESYTPRCKIVWLGIAAFFGYFLLLVSRSLHSIGRLPADPGYGYILEGSERGLQALLFGDPYFHLAARFLAFVASWFPLAQQVLALSILVHIVWAGCAVVIAAVVSLESRSGLLGYLSGLLLVSAPHASESVLGNVGNVKWPLIAALLAVCCSPSSVARRPTSSAVLAVITGFTQPLTIICCIPLFLDALRRRLFRKHLELVVVLIGTFLIQVAKVGIGDVTVGHSVKVTAPWPGMGLFWWSGFIAPITVSLSCVFFLLSRKRNELSMFALKISASAGLLSFASYQMGGIAGRYFVAPMTLALIAMLLIQRQIFANKPWLHRVSWLTSLLVLLVPSVKWFSSGPYLTDPPIWKSEISKAFHLCERDSSAVIAVSSSIYSGGDELDCSYILSE